MAEGERWLVHQPLYMVCSSGKDRCRLVETPEIWRMVCEGHEDQELGYLLVYVDDLLFVGSEQIVSSSMQAVRSMWQCSEPEYLDGEKSMRFCGFELRRVGDGVLYKKLVDEAQRGGNGVNTTTKIDRGGRARTVRIE